VSSGMIIVVQLSHKVGLFTCKQWGKFWCSPGKTSYSGPKNAKLAAAERIALLLPFSRTP
jgi:hypothetical protein